MLQTRPCCRRRCSWQLGQRSCQPPVGLDPCGTLRSSIVAELHAVHCRHTSSQAARHTPRAQAGTATAVGHMTPTPWASPAAARSQQASTLRTFLLTYAAPPACSTPHAVTQCGVCGGCPARHSLGSTYCRLCQPFPYPAAGGQAVPLREVCAAGRRPVGACADGRDGKLPGRRLCQLRRPAGRQPGKHEHSKACRPTLPAAAAVCSAPAFVVGGCRCNRAQSLVSAAGGVCTEWDTRGRQAAACVHPAAEAAAAPGSRRRAGLAVTAAAWQQRHPLAAAAAAWYGSAVLKAPLPGAHSSPCSAHARHLPRHRRRSLRQRSSTQETGRWFFPASQCSADRQQRVTAAATASRKAAHISAGSSSRQPAIAGRRHGLNAACSAHISLGGRQAGKVPSRPEGARGGFCPQELSEGTAPSNPSLSSRPFLIVILKAAFRALCQLSFGWLGLFLCPYVGHSTTKPSYFPEVSMAPASELCRQLRCLHSAGGHSAVYGSASVRLLHLSET